ncbi:hypothetical protein [Methylocaldum sp.]|jgi:integrase|uniref:hypothetical protein n=1 Tax=Methylocaldum sp. TaxID=1969727 RepID=UPI0032208F0F
MPSSLPTRTPSTNRAYQNRAEQLIRRFKHEHGKCWRAHPEAFYDWLINRREEFAKATWRQYKSALVYFFMDQGFTALALQLSQVINQGCTHRSQNTSAKKLKKLTDRDLRKLVGKLCEGNGRHDQLIAAWLVAGIATGLRPCEWQFARLDGDTLIVKNAKATNGRAHGPARRLHLDTLTPEQKNIIAAFISRIQDFADFGQLQKQCGDRLFRVTRCLWPKRQQHITLYSARHQFAANTKCAGLSLTEIAALMGHATDNTASQHYGRRTAGNRGQTPRANQSDMANVRKTYTARQADGTPNIDSDAGPAFNTS